MPRIYPDRIRINQADDVKRRVRERKEECFSTQIMLAFVYHDRKEKKTRVLT